MAAQGARLTRILLAGAAGVVVVAGLRAAASLMVPVLVAAFLATLAFPPVAWLRARRVPLGLAVALVMLLAVAALVGFFALLGTSVAEFSRQAPAYEAKLRAKVLALLQSPVLAPLEPTRRLEEALDPTRILNLTLALLGQLGDMLTNLALIVLTMVFILLEAADLPGRLAEALGRTEATLEAFHRFAHTLKRYVVIKTATSLATGLGVGLWLTLLGVDAPVLWGLLAFLFNFVPNIGSIIAALPAILLAWVQLGPGGMGLTALGYLAINTVIGSLLEPRVMGRGLGLSALMVFLSLLFWGFALGPVGYVLSVPLTVTVKIALETSPETRWVAHLLGPVEEEEPR